MYFTLLLIMFCLTSLHGLLFFICRYFDHFYMCIYALHVRVCEPKGDGISSHKNLLEDGILRICIWLVALSACFGNLFVILGRCLVKQDNLTHSLFIKNLSLADMLMGIYLMTIGIYDVKYKGEYLLHDEEWRESWECDACGVISTLSSEVSVLTLTLITYDRYICIIYPLHLRRKNAYSAYAKLCVIWIVCFILSVMPVLKLPYFGTNFYKNNAVCLPLHIHDPGGQGWEYSAFLFLGINSVSFSFIIYAYAVMFMTIRRSNINLRASYSNQENCLAKRFFLIVFTDFLCWIPIICVKIIALAGKTLDENCQNLLTKKCHELS